MFIISFNINGIRSHLTQLIKIINLYNPLFICLQETKVSNKIFPKSLFYNYGYNYIYFNGYKNHYGVAILSKIKANDIYYKFLNCNKDFKYRIIIGKFNIKNKNLLLINVYVPHGDNINNYLKFNYKILFINSLINYIKLIIKKNIFILVLGDINISPFNIDIGFNNYLKNKFIKLGKCSFLYKEILMYKKIINCGLFDIFRFKYPLVKKFTWFSYKYIKYNINGLRLDMFLSNKKLLDLCNNVGIDYSIKLINDKISDHIPIWSKFDF